MVGWSSAENEQNSILFSTYKCIKLARCVTKPNKTGCLTIAGNSTKQNKSLCLCPVWERQAEGLGRYTLYPGQFKSCLVKNSGDSGWTGTSVSRPLV